MEEKKYYSVKTLAVELEMTEQTIRRYIWAKKIPFHKMDRLIRFYHSEIREWVLNDMKMPLPSQVKKNEDGQ